jgi:hypothetical protein
MSALSPPPDFVGFQAFSFDVGSVRRHLADVRALWPDAVLAVGGPFPTGEAAAVFDFFPDADVAVRLCDVYPDGRSMIMQQGILRLRFRDSLAKERLSVAGTIYTVRVTLPDLALTFLPGHRLRLVISGSDYPHFDLNLNNGGPMYAAGDTLPVRIRIHHDAQNYSRIILPVAQASSPVLQARTAGHPRPRTGVGTIVVIDKRDAWRLTSRVLCDISGRRVTRGSRLGVYFEQRDESAQDLNDSRGR